MDTDIITWIRELLIRQQVRSINLNDILTHPHFCDREINNKRCKKTICLRTIQDEITECEASSQSVLDLLEVIDEFERKKTNLITEAMTVGYRAAAAELKEEKVGETEDERLGRAYVKEALLSHGAPRQDLKQKRKYGDGVEMGEGSKSNADPELVVFNEPAMQVDTEEGIKADARPELVVLDRPASLEIGQMQQNDVLESMDSQGIELIIRSTKFRYIPTPEVIKVRETLKSISMELKALVNDFLPEALCVSDAARAEIRKISLNKESSVENQNINDVNPPSPPGDAEVSGATMEILNLSIDVEVSTATMEIVNPSINAEVSRAATEILKPLPLQVIQNMKTNAELNRSPHILVEQNCTAFTVERNESIDGISQEVGNSMDKDKLPAESSRRQLASCKIKNVVRRRPCKRWSIAEEVALREGVKKFGAGNWTLILNSKHDLFVDRNAIDLKDKWRNMKKYSE